MKLSKCFKVLAASAILLAAGVTMTFAKGITPDRDVVRGKMSNGMDYYIRSNSEPQNRIQLRLIVKAGSCMEDEDQRGVAHFVEHMAFNGTTNFEKNTLVSTIESFGMGFGADLNAYTSFNETVYQLEVPADKPEYLETALLILHDWACGVTFEQEELDKERGVVTEEWRGSIGLNGRLRDAFMPFFMTDSRYAERLPIGDMDIIANVSRERVMDFYSKWYRSDNMAVAVVGDADAAYLEEVCKRVMSTVPKAKGKTKRPEYKVPKYKEDKTLFFIDSEMPDTEIMLMSQQVNIKPSKTMKDFKKNLAISMTYSIFANRIRELTVKDDCPWLDCSATNIGYSDDSTAYGLYVVPKPGKSIEALKAGMDEYQRYARFGATQSELDFIKKSFASSNESYHAQIANITSTSYISSIVEEAMGEVNVSPEDWYQIRKECIETMTLKDLDAIRKEFITAKTTRLGVLSSPSLIDATQEEFEDVWHNYVNPDLTPYGGISVDGTLMSRPDKEGEAKKTGYIKELDTTEYTLSNGIKLYLKKTDFDKNQVVSYAISKGGDSVVSDDDYPSSQVAFNYVYLSGVGEMDYSALIQSLSDKNIGLNCGVGSYSENIYGNFVNDEYNMESYFQLMYLFMNKPRFTDDGWNYLMSVLGQQAQSYGSQPGDLFYQQVQDLIYGDIRHAPFDMDYLAKIDRTKAEKFYNEHFTNPLDFTYVFVGDFDEESLLDMAECYLGSIKGKAANDEFGKYDKKYDAVKGIKSATVTKGLDNQGKVEIQFRKKAVPAKNAAEYYKNEEELWILNRVLDIRLREIVREDKGGTYGVGVYSGLTGRDGYNSYLGVYFGCEPEREEELMSEVIKELKNICANGIDESYIQKVTETERRTYEENLRNNYYWRSNIINSMIYDYLPLDYVKIDEEIWNSADSEFIKELCRKYTDFDNYVLVNLVPEK